MYTTERYCRNIKKMDTIAKNILKSNEQSKNPKKPIKSGFYELSTL